MEAPRIDPDPATPLRVDWEAFYASYRKPGYVAGFEIQNKLGGGMFGLVFKARKESIGKDYAIKFLQVEDTEVRRAVLAELEQVKWFAQIDHPNLVSIEDRGEVDGIPYLVMSFAGTQTLKDRIATDGKAPVGEERDELLRYFLQACRGVAALHDTNGRWDLLAELRASSNAELSAVLERVRLIKGIASTETNILLATYR